MGGAARRRRGLAADRAVARRPLPCPGLQVRAAFLFTCASGAVPGHPRGLASDSSARRELFLRLQCAWRLPCMVSPPEPPCLYAATINPVPPVHQADRAHCHDPPVPHAASPAHAYARLRSGGPRGRPRQQRMPHGGRPGR